MLPFSYPPPREYHRRNHIVPSISMVIISQLIFQKLHSYVREGKCPLSIRANYSAITAECKVRAPDRNDMGQFPSTNTSMLSDAIWLPPEKHKQLTVQNSTLVGSYWQVKIGCQKLPERQCSAWGIRPGDSGWRPSPLDNDRMSSWCHNDRALNPRTVAIKFHID